MPGPCSAPDGFRKGIVRSGIVSSGGVMNIRTGKTKHDHESGKWGRRIGNRKNRGNRDSGWVEPKKRDK